MNVLFIEKQRFTQWWLWLFLIIMTLIPVFGILRQIVQGKPFGNNPLSDTGLIVFLVSMLIMLGIFRALRLRTVINEEWIHIKFFPFVNRKVAWTDVQSASVVNYGFVGGWGVKYSSSYGIVYNVTGNMGLALKLKNGKKLCIGTQKPNELRDTIVRVSRLHKL